MTISRLRNPVETCGWCGHPMEMHDFTVSIEWDPTIDFTATMCAHCPDNICDITKIYIEDDIATIYGGNDCV